MIHHRQTDSESEHKLLLLIMSVWTFLFSLMLTVYFLTISWLSLQQICHLTINLQTIDFKNMLPCVLGLIVHHNEGKKLHILPLWVQASQLDCQWWRKRVVLIASAEDMSVFRRSMEIQSQMTGSKKLLKFYLLHLSFTQMCTFCECGMQGDVVCCDKQNLKEHLVSHIPWISNGIIIDYDDDGV